MTGLKTNERPGTRAVLRHYRMSASKARQVLDLIRGEDVETAAEILRTTSREAATVVGQVLASAVANAVHNDGQDAEDLFVSACFADEGATQKRWRPRARGRASRIRKRTCHITVIVSMLPDERLERRRAQREEVTAQRSRRVSESRRRADLSGRLSRRRHAQEAEREAAEAEAARAAEVEGELVEDAAAEQAAEDVVEAEAERVGAETSDEEVAEQAAAEVAGEETGDGDEVAARDGTEEASAGDESAPADDDDSEKGE
ncbi:MAG: 50S ribosomal protein L22 [Acidimicrobiales bacterium]